MSKEKYNKPVMEVVNLEDDVILTSGQQTGCYQDNCFANTACADAACPNYSPCSDCSWYSSNTGGDSVLGGGGGYTLP